MPAPTLDGRLPCASSAAYAITGDMTTLAPDPKDVYISGAGFVQPPSVDTAGLDGIDGCLVGGAEVGVAGLGRREVDDLERRRASDRLGGPSRPGRPSLPLCCAR